MKDLTNIAEYSKNLEEKGELPPAPEGSLVEESKVEEIQSFESLDEYSKSSEAQVEAQESPAQEQESPPGEFSSAITGINADNSLATDGLAASVVTEEPPKLDLSEPAPETSPNSSDSADSSMMGEIKTFAERLSIVKKAVPASFPFSVLIDGHLTSSEKEKLLEIIEQENIGISKMDIEPQFAAGRVLIPRISEYAGVVIVQALRGANASFKLGPSDQVYSKNEKLDDESTLIAVSKNDEARIEITEEISHPAEDLPITSDASIVGMEKFSIIGMITATAALRTTLVEAERSSEYQEILDNLQREVKYKAYRKGAKAVVNFKVTLTGLMSPSYYRLTALGTGIKPL